MQEPILDLLHEQLRFGNQSYIGRYQNFILQLSILVFVLCWWLVCWIQFFQHRNCVVSLIDQLVPGPIFSRINTNSLIIVDRLWGRTSIARICRNSWNNVRIVRLHENALQAKEGEEKVEKGFQNDGPHQARIAKCPTKCIT